MNPAGSGTALEAGLSGLAVPLPRLTGSQSTAQNTNIVFDAGHSNLISVSDVDAGGGAVRISLAATHGLIDLATTAGLFYGMAFVYMRRHLIGVEPIVAASGQLLMAAALSLPFAVATSATNGLHLSVRRALAIGALGVIGTGAAYLLNYRIIADVGATRASVVNTG